MPVRLCVLACIAVFAFVLAARPAAAADKRPVKAGIAPQKLPVSVPENSTLPVSTAPLRDVGDVLVHFAEIDGALKSLSADFKQNITMSESNMIQKVSGTIAYLKPNHLHMRHVLPEQQNVVSDGKSIWIFRKAHNQVIESNLEDWKKSDPLMDNLLDSVGSYTNLLKRYNVAYDSADYCVTLSPKDGKGDFVLRLRLSGPEKFPRETELTVAEMRVDTVFENVRFNPTLSATEFTFIPPPGADVFRNFKPPQRMADGGKP